MKRFHVYLVGTVDRVLSAQSLDAAEAVALADAEERWPGVRWQVAETEEEL